MPSLPVLVAVVVEMVQAVVVVVNMRVVIWLIACIVTAIAMIVVVVTSAMTPAQAALRIVRTACSSLLSRMRLWTSAIGPSSAPERI